MEDFPEEADPVHQGSWKIIVEAVVARCTQLRYRALGTGMKGWYTSAKSNFLDLNLVALNPEA